MRLRIKEQENQKIPLQAMIDVNNAVGSILKESYKNLAGKKSTSKTSELQIYVGNFDNGSLIEQIMLEIQNDPHGAATQLAFNALTINTQNIYDITKSALEFLITLGQGKKDGITYNIHIEKGATAFVVTGDNVSIGDVSFEAAGDIARHGELLTKPIKSGALSEIELFEGSDKITFDENNYDCFEKVIDVSEEVRIIDGNIIQFNKELGTGKVKFWDNMKERVLRFSITGTRYLFEVIDSMKEQTCKIYCHEEYLRGPSGRQKVVSLQVFKIEKSGKKPAKQRQVRDPEQLSIDE